MLGSIDPERKEQIMASKEQNHAADSGAFRQKGGPFDYSPEADEEKRRLEALKSHDRGEQDGLYIQPGGV